MERLSESIDELFKIFALSVSRDAKVGICEFVESLGFHLDWTPYHREPLECYAAAESSDITIMAPEQTGKSQFARWGMAYSLSFERKTSILYVYESSKKGARINRTEFEPVFRKIPKLDAWMNLPGAVTSEEYRFPCGSSYFIGAGAPITSYTVGKVFGDEIDKYPKTEGEVDNIANLAKRLRAWQGHTKFCKVCTPELEDGPINASFLNSSMGYWHLRCKGCGKLTIPSHAANGVFDKSSGEIKGGIQFKRDEKGVILDDTLRLVCPKCGFEHVESQHRWMTVNGGYIHKKPALIHSRPGFQWGALAPTHDLVQKDFKWREIAVRILKSGRDGTLEDQKDFDRTIRGLPWKPRKSASQEEGEKILVPHVFSQREKYEFILMGVDTQKDILYWVVRGYWYEIKTVDGKEAEVLHSQKIECGIANNFEQLGEVSRRGFCGMEVTGYIQDEGGHRGDEVRGFVEGKQRFYTYKGAPISTSFISGKFVQFSKNVSRLLLANEPHYRENLLYMIHKAPSSRWQLNDDANTEYASHLLSYREDENKKKNRDLYRNWTRGDREDHYFDCEKMLLALADMPNCVDGFPPWRNIASYKTPEGLKKMTETYDVLSKLSKTNKLFRRKS